MADTQLHSENWNQFLKEREGFLDPDQPQKSTSAILLHQDMRKLELKGMDLSRSRFHDCNFSGMNLESVDFASCSFEKCDFSNAILKQAQLNNCFLRGINLSGTNLVEAVLAESNLEGADLGGCDLTSADLEGAQLFDTNFTDAVLVNTDFSSTRAHGVIFTEADMRGVDLTSADCTKADLTDANLTGANLSSTKLNQAQLVNTNFHDADLINTKLGGAITLGMNIGGANLTNAILPGEVAKFESIKIIDESSKILRTLFLTLLSVVAFSLLTISSTTDAQLLTNSSSFKLPIIGTPISIQQFYLIAPFGIGGIFLYFHLYLLKHYRLIAKLPSVFPDGTSFDERLHPWMFNTWVKVFFPKIKSQDKLADILSESIIIFLGWMLVPSLLLVFMGRYVVHRSPDVTELHFWLTIIALITASYLLLVLEKKVFATSLSFKNRALRGMWFLFIFGSTLSIYFLPEIMEVYSTKFTRHLLQANFQRQDVSIRPKSWDPKEPLRGVQGANLDNANLSGAKGYNAFMVKADLRGANLKHSLFESADFRGASFHITRMQGGIFVEANFEGAYFYGARMNEAEFIRANFRKAHFEHTVLEGAVLAVADFRLARFTNARMEGAKLKMADLKYAIFKKVKGLTVKQVKEARNWQWALYDNELRKELGITDGDLNIRLWQIIKEQYPDFSKEDRDEKISEWMKVYELK